MLASVVRVEARLPKARPLRPRLDASVLSIDDQALINKFCIRSVGRIPSMAPMSSCEAKRVFFSFCQGSLFQFPFFLLLAM